MKLSPLDKRGMTINLLWILQSNYLCVAPLSSPGQWGGKAIQEVKEGSRSLESSLLKTSLQAPRCAKKESSVTIFASFASFASCV